MADSCPRCGETRNRVTIGGCKHSWHLAVVLANKAREELGSEEQWQRIFAHLRKLRTADRENANE